MTTFVMFGLPVVGRIPWGAGGFGPGLAAREADIGEGIIREAGEGAPLAGNFEQF